MKLLLVGELFWQNTEFDKLIGNYKYRDDVVVVADASLVNESHIVASAYAYIQPYAFHNFLFSFDAICSGVPALIVNSPGKELFSEAAIYFEPDNPADMADKMMLIYKDESLRSQLIEKSKKINSNYTWEITINTVGQHLQLSGTN